MNLAAVTRILVLLLSLALSPIGCHYDKNNNGTDRMGADIIAQESISRLLATPERFAGRAVGFWAFVRIVFESHGAFATEDDGQHRNTSNALWLEFDNLDVDYGRYPGVWCVVEGVFDPEHRGHLGLYGGGILHSKIRNCRTSKP